MISVNPFSRWSERPRAAGFTLIEMIMTLLLIGILAAFATVRFTGRELDERGFHDGTLAYLRFAQKKAIVQRRTVCVSFSANSISLSMASAAATYDCNVPATIRGPRDDTPPTLTAPAGVSYVTPPANFNFDSLGRPIDSSGALVAQQTFQVNGLALSMTVEPGAGYVHD